MANREDLGGGQPPAAAPDTHDLKQKASDVLDDAKEQAKNLASQAKDGTVKAASQARDQVSQLVTRRKDQTADRLGSLAGALRDTAHKLQEQDAEGFGQYADRAAEQLERLSSYLKDHELRGLMRDTETFARRRPDLFLGGTFLAGLALARFLKSSAPERPGGNRPYQRAAAGTQSQGQQRSSWAPERRSPG